MKYCTLGVTNDLVRRIYEHKQKMIEGFTSKYNIDKLIYYEILDDIENAIKREKQLKNWHHDWKMNLIRAMNYNLEDLYEKVL